MHTAKKQRIKKNEEIEEYLQVKEQDKTSEKALIKTEISGFLDKELKLKVIKMLSLEECMNREFQQR